MLMRPGSGSGSDTVPVSMNALPHPGSDTAQPQTHIFPRISRFPCTASFALHRKGGEGVWAPILSLPASAQA